MQGGLMHRAVGVQPVAHLKTAHGRIDIGIEYLRFTRVELEVAGHR